MSCIYFQHDSLHTLSETEIKDHIKSCSLCADRVSFENKILQEAHDLTPINVDKDLWSKIEINLKDKTNSKNIFILFWKHKIVFTAAASLFILASLFTFYFFTPVNSTGVLSHAAILKVEFSEQNYLQAIEDLEEEAQPILANLEFDLMLLYHDKLETIQTQINLCREAINKNPGNAHIRRYMLAALQDKKETLNEIINYSEI